MFVEINGKTYKAMTLNDVVRSHDQRRQKPSVHSRHTHSQNAKALEIFRDGYLLEPSVAVGLYDRGVSQAELKAVCVPSTGRIK